MYYCENCRKKFECLRKGFERYPDYGGEVVWCCPICGVPGHWEEIAWQENE